MLRDMMEDHPGVTMTIACVLIIGVMLWLALAVDRFQCKMLGENTERQTKYSAGKCYVKQDGRWMRDSELGLYNASKGK